MDPTAPCAVPQEQLDAFARAVRAKIERDLAEEQATAERLRAAALPALRGTLDSLRRQGHVGRAWLFGSYAWGQPMERSDLDVLFEGPGDALHVAACISETTGLMVHALPTSGAPEGLSDRVRREGVEL